MTKYAVVEHYPDGNSGVVALFTTHQDAQHYIATHHYDLCTIEQVRVTTIVSH